MRTAAANLEFEEAAQMRDEIRRLERADLEIGDAAPLGPKRFAARIRAASNRSGAAVKKTRTAHSRRREGSSRFAPRPSRGTSPPSAT